MSCQICFFPFRSLKKSQAMLKLLGGTLSTPVLVGPIKPWSAVGMRIDKIFTLPKSWQKAASRLAPGLPQHPESTGAYCTDPWTPWICGEACESGISVKTIWWLKQKMQSHGKSTSAMNDSHSTKIYKTALGMGIGSEHEEVFQRGSIVLCGDRVWRNHGFPSFVWKNYLCGRGKDRRGLEYPFHKYSALKKCKSTGIFFLFILWSGAGNLLNYDKKNSADWAVRFLTIDI